MSEESVMPSAPYPSLPTSWRQVWPTILLQPSVATFQALLSHPEATSKKAYNWMVVSTLLGSVFATFINAIFATVGLLLGWNTGNIWEDIFFQLICAVPIGAVVTLILFIIGTGITHFVAIALGGTGTYSKLAYGFAAYSAPLGLIFSVLGSIPLINLCLILPLAVYGFILSVLGVKAVHQLPLGLATISSVARILILTILLVLFVVGIIFALLLLGPSIGESFSGIAPTQ